MTSALSAGRSPRSKAASSSLVEAMHSGLVQKYQGGIAAIESGSPQLIVLSLDSVPLMAGTV